MIMFRCACGAAYRVKDNYAGGEAECQSCGKKVAIPRESDPDVLLVFKGSDSEPNPLSREAVAAGLAEGTLATNDLFWDGAKWATLDPDLLAGEQVDLSGFGKNRTKPGTVHIAASGGRMGTEIVSLPPIQLKEHADEKVVQRLPLEISASKRLPRRWFKLALGVVLVAAAGYGLVRYAWPAFSGMMRRSAQVIVYNAQSEEAAVQLDEKAQVRQVGPGQVAVLSIRARKRLEHKVAIAGQSYQFSVEPGRVTLLTLGTPETYRILDRGVLASVREGVPLQELIGQIQKLQMPSAAAKMVKRLQDITRSGMGPEVADGILPAQEKGYDIQAPAGSLVRMSEAPDKPLLLLKASERFSLEKGWFDYDLRGDRLTDLEIALPAFSFNLERLFRVEVRAGQTMRLWRHGDSLKLEMAVSGQRIQQEDTTVHGNWSFNATVPAPESSTGPRYWEWRFKGHRMIAGSRFNVIVVIDSGGKRKVDIEKV